MKNCLLHYLECDKLDLSNRRAAIMHRRYNLISSLEVRLLSSPETKKYLIPLTISRKAFYSFSYFCHICETTF